MTEFSLRMQTFRGRLAETGIDVALITDDDNVYYLTGYYDYLHMNSVARRYWPCRARGTACS